MSKAKVLIIFALLSGSILLLSCSNPTEEEGGSSSSTRMNRSSSSRTGGQSSSSVNLSSSNDDSGSSSSDEVSSSDSSSSNETDPQSSSSDDSSSSSSADSSSSSNADSSSSSSANSSSSSSANSSSSRSSNSSSSSRSNSSSSSSNAISSSSNAAVTGEFTDSRDSKKYKTVVIGTQTWMAENLNYKPNSSSGRLDRCYAEGGGQDDWLKPGDPKIEQNCQKYGRLYDWATANAVCPQGWHLPSRDEWNKLKDYVFEILWENYEDEDFGWDVGTKLKATSGWKAHSEPGCGNGVDTYGFKAIGGGYCFSCDKLTSAEGSYSGIGNRGDGDGETARWWTATEHASTKGNAYRFEVTYSSNVLTERSNEKSDLYSVRCLKN